MRRRRTVAKQRIPEAADRQIKELKKLKKRE
jgi:hypothetical protein